MALKISATAALINWASSQIASTSPFAKIILSQYCGITQLVLAAVSKQLRPQFRDDIKTADRVNFVIRGLLAEAAIADQWQLFLRGGLGVRLALDSFNLLSAGLASAEIFRYGTNLVVASAQDQFAWKVGMRVVGGSFLTAVASLGLYSCLNSGMKMFDGLSTYRTLDDEQKYFVLRYGTISHLNQVKPCQAVIVDSSIAHGSRKTTLTPSFVEELYRHCNVQAFRINDIIINPCAAIKKAAETKGKIDILYLFGHGNSDRMYGLDHDDRYHMGWGTPSDISCLEPHLATNATVGLMACNSGKGKNPLAERVSSCLPGKKVIGFADFFATALSATAQSGKQVDTKAWFSSLWQNTAKSFCTERPGFLCG
ncbi:MAG TPA: hypothetical protein VLG76_03850 [Rhabdochlamydiaceae bacterium]|nr:hypothetical protein [Rhabdochlamydiaceae bacterium]HSX37988.1 hypothetical protein [Chlamydiales bacterium]